MKEKLHLVEFRTDHPRIDRVSKTRKVLYVNFRGNRAEIDFCARFREANLFEALKRPDAAMAFLSEIERFETRDPAFLTAPILIAINTGGGRAHYFVSNLGCFAQVMDPKALGGALCQALGADEGASRYFVRHIAHFRGLPYLGRATLERAMKVAANKLRG